MYKNLGFEISYEYLSRGTEPTDGPNTYQSRGTSQGKITPIKRHFACFIFGIVGTPTD